VSANAPAQDFWSLTVYDNETRSMLQNAKNDASVSSYGNLEKNADGSIDVVFAPNAPAGIEKNWIQKGLFRVVPSLPPDRAILRQVLAAAGHREGQLDDACTAALSGPPGRHTEARQDSPRSVRAGDDATETERPPAGFPERLALG
jgi:hypothetical protein